MENLQIIIDPHKLFMARQAKRWLIQEAADKIGICRATLSKYENGRTRVFADNLVKMSYVYEVDVMSFVTLKPIE